MADGGGGTATGLRLGACALTGLRARCVCGREAAIDPGIWLAQGLGAAPLEGLESRLRCACGARRVALAPGGGEAGKFPRAGAIWVFR